MLPIQISFNLIHCLILQFWKIDKTFIIKMLQRLKGSDIPTNKTLSKQDASLPSLLNLFKITVSLPL